MSRVGCWLALALLGWCLTALPAAAEEPFTQFLDGLRDRELFDMALEYLDIMSKSPLVSDELKTGIPYERGKTLIDSSRNDRDPKSKGRTLDQATEQLQAFLKNQPNSRVAGAASMALGSVIFERGRMFLEQAGQPKNVKSKDALNKQARDHFNQALKVFTDAETKFDKRLNELPKGAIDPKEKAVKEERDQVRTDFLAANVYSSAVLQEIAKTHAEGSKEYKDSLLAAANKNKKIYERFRLLMAGQYAHIKQGECLQLMGDHKAAIGIYNDILGQPEDAAEFRKLQAAALYRKLQCHLAMKDTELAAKGGEEWIGKIAGNEESMPDWLAVFYFTATAEKMLSDALPEKDKQKAAYLKSARENLLRVVKYPGPYRDDARQLLSKVTGKDELQKEPVNFAEAFERVGGLLEEIQAKQSDLQSKQNVPGGGDKAEVAALTKEIDEMREQIIKYCHVALKLRDRETPLDQILEIRYFLCYMAYQQEKFYEAAVMGDFIATRYADKQRAKSAAMLTLASFLKTYSDTTQQMKDTRQFDHDKMTAMARYISTRWKGEPESDEAWNIMLSVAVQERDTKSALEALSYIPETSANRGDAEVKLSKALWSKYRHDSIKPEGERPPQTELDAMGKQARTMLETGLGRLRKLDNVVVTAEIFLGMLTDVEMCLAANQPDQAIKLLNDPKLGPLTLLGKGEQVALTEVGTTSFPVETYKSALRAYIGNKDVDNAQKMMAELDKLMANRGPQGQAQLTLVYVSMGKALEEQIKLLREQGKNDDVKKVTSAFEVFLDKISSAAQGTTFGSLTWVAETFYSLGVSFDEGIDKPAQGEAATYYGKSLATEQKILAEGAKNPGFMPSPHAANAVKLRIARDMRRLGQFDGALKEVGDILKQQQMLVDAQIEGCRILMYKGADKKDANDIARSIVGGLPDANKKNLVMGWTKLIGVLQQAITQNAANQQARERFMAWLFDCNEYAVDARMKHAEIQADPQQKKAGRQRAQRQINILVQTYPDLTTDPKWADHLARFNSQMKTLQKLLAEPPVGIVPPKIEPAATEGQPANAQAAAPAAAQ
ncbi:MAG: hypothetical protein JSS27_12475 [Planctomycetes bacterium]|nr:hypothetical protein [Planctomycetota bacterium]